MRVIAGRAKGHRLAAPPGSGTRPMTDRAKEALFSSLGSLVDGARVLDLYAGSGSLGIEAMSRGAAGAVFVDRDARAGQTIRRNIAHTGMEGEVVVADVAAYVDRAGGRFDLVFVDPPYALSLASLTEVLVAVEPLLASGATVIVHRRAGGEAAPEIPGLRLTDIRRYGDSELWKLEKEDL